MLHKFLYDVYDTNYFQTCEFSEKDLKFCITTIELGYDVSFLKLLQLIVDGDVELNPGPTNTTPKGRQPKKKLFNFASKTLDMHNLSNNIKTPNCVNQNNITSKIKIIQSDITIVECDAIVNAANVTLLGGGGIDFIIHNKAGKELLRKCKKFPVKGKSTTGEDIRCPVGECMVTNTNKTKLTNCSYVFHTVGPDCRKENNMNTNAKLLKSCYKTCLQNVLDHKIKSIAFCCISTGIYEYPNKDAAELAFDTVTSWLKDNQQSVEKIIFCTYELDDYNLYNDLMKKNECILLPSCSTRKPSEHTDNNTIEMADSSIDFSTNRDNIPIAENTAVAENIPVALQNSGHNVCFFNSAVQVLYSLLSFRTHINNTTLNNIVVYNLKKLFGKIDDARSSHFSVYTYQIVLDLIIPNYIDRQQHDVLNLISYILDNSFIKDNKGITIHTLFKMTENKSIMCNNCGKESRTSYDIPIFTLAVDPSQRQTIRGLLDRVFDEHGYPLPQYQCKIERDKNGNEKLDANGNRKGCDVIGRCNESIQLTNFNDFMILQLKIYSEDNYGRRRKIFPYMTIDHEVHRYDYFDLQGIIWHHGSSFEHGHYTSNIKVNGIWYDANDTVISQGATFQCYPNSRKAPYIIVYKKGILNLYYIVMLIILLPVLQLMKL